MIFPDVTWWWNAPFDDCQWAVTCGRSRPSPSSPVMLLLPLILSPPPATHNQQCYAFGRGAESRTCFIGNYSLSTPSTRLAINSVLALAADVGSEILQSRCKSQICFVSVQCRARGRWPLPSVAPALNNRRFHQSTIFTCDLPSQCRARGRRPLPSVAPAPRPVAAAPGHPHSPAAAPAGRASPGPPHHAPATLWGYDDR